MSHDAEPLRMAADDGSGLYRRFREHWASGAGGKVPDDVLAELEHPQRLGGEFYNQVREVELPDPETGKPCRCLEVKLLGSVIVSMCDDDPANRSMLRNHAFFEITDPQNRPHAAMYAKELGEFVLMENIIMATHPPRAPVRTRGAEKGNRRRK